MKETTASDDGYFVFEDTILQVRTERREGGRRLGGSAFCPPTVRCLQYCAAEVMSNYTQFCIAQLHMFQ